CWATRWPPTPARPASAWRMPHSPMPILRSWRRLPPPASQLFTQSRGPWRGLLVVLYWATPALLVLALAAWVLQPADSLGGGHPALRLTAPAVDPHRLRGRWCIA